MKQNRSMKRLVMALALVLGLTAAGFGAFSSYAAEGTPGDGNWVKNMEGLEETGKKADAGAGKMVQARNGQDEEAAVDGGKTAKTAEEKTAQKATEKSRGTGVCDGTGKGYGPGNSDGVCDGTCDNNGICDGTGKESNAGEKAGQGYGPGDGSGNKANKESGAGVCDGTGPKGEARR